MPTHFLLDENKNALENSTVALMLAVSGYYLADFPEYLTQNQEPLELAANFLIVDAPEK